MNRKLKKKLVRIIIASILFAAIFIVDKVTDFSFINIPHDYAFLLPLGLYLIPYIIVAYDVLYKSFRNIIHGQIFDENFLMSIATFGAFAIREFPEAVAVMLFYQIGEFFQDLAVHRSRKEISSLMDIRPEFAHILTSDNSLETVVPELVNVGDIIRVEPGEKIPLDGVVISGCSSIDTKSLTGESLPVDVDIDSKVISGTINLTYSIDVRVEKSFSDSAVSKILELVENSSSVKSKHENFISKFAKWYTPLVVISAFLLALIGSLISHDVETWVARALNFLVVSCPCAIVISVPLSFFISIGRAAKIGILIKGSLYLEMFNDVDTFVFDKTGTLTKGNFAITKIVPNDNKELILKAAGICEGQSTHPIAVSIRNYVINDIDTTYKILNIPGKGVIAEKEGHRYLCGNHKLFLDNNIKIEEIDEGNTVIYVGENNRYLGAIIIEDELKETSKDVLTYLTNNKCQTIMLTGDNEKVASKVASNLALTAYKSSLLPQDKVNEFEKIMNNKKQGLVAYIGDGINDAPTLARADIGISMGGVGSDAALEASDIVLMNDDLKGLITAKKIAKKTITIIKENIVFALGVKLAILGLSAFGLASIWLAVFGDVGVALLCILNALRSGKIKT